jgi:signal peptidase I
MTLHRRWFSSFSSAIWLVFAFAAWSVFAPIPLGGNSAYVIVSGISMEPEFHLGDLVIVSPSPYYGVGDAVVYRNQDMGGKNVFHRIIELNLDRYVLQGDNNSWVDTYQPTDEEVLGKLWIHIPRGGRLLEKARTPLGMALLAGVLGLLLVTSSFPERRKEKIQMNRNTIREWISSAGKKIASLFEKHQRENPFPSKQPDGHPSYLAGLSEIFFFTLGIVSFSSLVFAIISFSRPSTRNVMDNLLYEQSGVFSYSAKAPQGVYDLDTIKSGDPLFPKLTCKVDFDFQYALLAEKVENIAGTHQLTAIIADPRSGWKRILVLQPVTPFGGETFTSAATVNLCEIESIVRSFETNSAASPASYELIISPQVSLSAEIDGIAFQDTFEDGLKFLYDHNQFHIVADTEKDPFKLTKPGSAGRERSEANTLSLFGLDLRIPSLRWFSIIGLGVSLTGMAFLWRELQRLSQKDQAEFIRAKYGPILMDIQGVKAGSFKSLIDVPSFDDLAKVAERHNLMVLHEKRDNSHTYYVRVETSTYRFVLDAVEPVQMELRETES